jgi:hypothetical protein
MSLVKKHPLGWQGTISKHVYMAPQECKESAEAQELQVSRRVSSQMGIPAKMNASSERKPNGIPG